MKVLQINAIYELFSTGRMTKEMHESFLSKGIQSYVASPSLNGLDENSYMIGSSFDRKVHALFSRVFGLQGYFSKTATKKLIKYIDLISPDVIHLGNLHSNFIDLKLLLNYISKNDIPTVITLHDSWFYTGKCTYYIENNCDRWKDSCGHCPALKKGNKSYFFDRSRKVLRDKKEWFESIPRLAVIGVSKWTAEDTKKSILKNAKIIQTIYNWIDLDMFKPYSNREEERETFLKEKGIDASKTVLLGIAAGWNTVKGVHIFNSLADKLPDNYQIVMIGHCDESLMSEKVFYAGVVNDMACLSKYYSSSDIFINPSIQETFGLTTAEAMACGTPVVAYNATATPELVGTDGSCGIIINNNNPEDYIDTIIGLDNETRCIMSENCRKRAEEMFSKEKNIQEYIRIYERLLRNEKK